EPVEDVPRAGRPARDGTSRRGQRADQQHAQDDRDSGASQHRGGLLLVGQGRTGTTRAPARGSSIAWGPPSVGPRRRYSQPPPKGRYTEIRFRAISPCAAASRSCCWTWVSSRLNNRLKSIVPV